jgi:tetratricopeptide (TPR) repeat protein/transcriptional regulator with XRE-family HTH domain
MNRPHDVSSITPLRRERIRRNWRQQDLAEQLGTTVATVKRWEQGSHLPGPYFRVKLCALFGKSAEELGLIPDTIPSPAAEDISPFCLPFLRNPYFTGRESLLAHLHAMLAQQPAKAALTQAYSVHGLGGIGKTQLAVEYAYQYRRAYRAVLWMQAETQASVMASFGQMATALRLTTPGEAHDLTMVASVLSWLNAHGGWLLICDNVEDLALLKPFLPTCDQGALLFTSRMPSLGTLAQPLILPPLSTKEGAAFLLARTILPDWDAQEQEAARAITELMGGLPLALEQAGAYIQATQCRLSDYLHLFKSMPDRLLDTHEPGHDHPLSVMRTFMLACDQVARHNAQAMELLTVCAFLAAEAIPEQLFLDGAASLGWSELPANRMDFEEAIKELLSYALVQRSASTRTITVHRLVQAVLLARLSTAERHTWGRRVIEVMERHFPAEYTTQQDALMVGEQLLPHAHSCLALTEDEEVEVPRIRLLLHMAAYLLQRGRYGEAEACCEQAQQQGERLLGSAHPLIAEAVLGLAQVQRDQGHFAQAEPLYEQAMSLYAQTVGEEHAEMATCLNSFGALYEEQGKYPQATVCFERARSILERVLGPEHPRVATSLGSLGIVCARQGHYQQAIHYYERALCILERSLGAEHPQVAKTYNNLGVLHTEQGQYPQAARYLEQALHIREHTLGPEHPYIAQTFLNLGFLAENQGEYQQAKRFLERALDIWEKQPDAEHPEVAHALTSLGNIARQQGHDVQATAYYERALYIYEQSSGPDHPFVASPLNGLAELAVAQARYEQADVYFQRALLAYHQHQIVQHPNLAEILHDLAHLRQLQGRTDEALALYQQAQAMCEQIYGPHHPKTEANNQAIHQLA